MRRTSIAAIAAALFLSGCAIAPNAPHRTISLPETISDSKKSIIATPQAILDRLRETCNLNASLPWAGTPSDEKRIVNPYETSAKDDPCAKQSIEVSQRYTLFFVEFDEQGRLYDDVQLKQLFAYLNNRIDCGRELSIVTFVHGWRHSADRMDGNVILARDILSFTYQGENSEPHPNIYRRTRDDYRLKDERSCGAARTDAREVIGIYVGWRGKSIDATVFGSKNIFVNLELLSVYDRKLTAENVATGSVRELFTRLRVFQDKQNEFENDCKPENQTGYQCKRVRLLIVGHSFGGLLVYNAVSASILESLSQGSDVVVSNETCYDQKLSPAQEQVATDAAAHPESRKAVSALPSSTKAPAIVRSFADLIVLINPAIEGARYEAFQQALNHRTESGGFCKNQKPVLIIVTAQNDLATSTAFPLFRKTTTIFENTTPVGVGGPDVERIRKSEEDQAAVNAMGHIPRFTTHTMKGTDSLLSDHEQLDSDSTDLANYCTSAPADALQTALATCRCRQRASGVAHTLEPPDANRWYDYIRQNSEEFEKTRDPRRLSCSTYVEEINSAEYMIGTIPRVASYPRGAESGSATLYSVPKWTQAFCGGAVLSHQHEYLPIDATGGAMPQAYATTHLPFSPVWMIKSVDTSMIDNHNGIQQFPFKTFIQQAYHQVSVANFDHDAFARVRDNALGKFRENCQ